GGPGGVPTRPDRGRGAVAQGPPRARHGRLGASTRRAALLVGAARRASPLGRGAGRHSGGPARAGTPEHPRHPGAAGVAPAAADGLSRAVRPARPRDRRPVFRPGRRRGGAGRAAGPAGARLATPPAAWLATNGVAAVRAGGRQGPTEATAPLDVDVGRLVVRVV